MSYNYSVVLKQKLLKHKIILAVLLFYILSYPFDDKLPLGTN